MTILALISRANNALSPQSNDVSDCSHFEYVFHVFAPLAWGLPKGA
jgi:hypothetical protein